MILQALADYYNRKSASDPGLLPSLGFEPKKIPVIFEIDEQGACVQVRELDAKSDDAVFVVPQGEKKTSGVRANLLWDTVEYTLGLNTKDAPDEEDEEKREEILNKQQARISEQRQAFLDRLTDLPEPAASDVGIKALLKFLQGIDAYALASHPAYETLKTNPNVSFWLNGDAHLICQRPAVIETIKALAPADEAEVCLMTGEHDQIERVHPSIKGVWGAQSSGANIVSFNLRAVDSYGKTQGQNAPVGKKSSFAYTTALNFLLRKGSSQRFQVGDTSTVFWAQRPDENSEFVDIFSTVFGATPAQIKDNPDMHTRAVRDIYAAVSKGAMPPSEANKFFVLGLAPNAARIAIRFWHVDTIAAFSGRIKRHFDDLEICRAPYDPEHLPLFHLLTSIAVLGKVENIPPNLAGELMRSILTGHAYPQTLLASAIRRCRTEQQITYTRAALIKACLNRNSKKEVITVGLDAKNTDIAYRLGRFFAALERLQEYAHWDEQQGKSAIKKTIRDSYYSSASSSPASVFGTLDKLSKHHLEKLGKLGGKKSDGRKIWLEKLLQEIAWELPPDLPKTLILRDQAKFAMGYYHQRQDFFPTQNTTDAGDAK